MNALLPDNQSNHLELSCLGNAITASINGSQVASVEDRTYAQGQAGILAGTFTTTAPATLFDVRFDNLAVSVPAPQRPPVGPTNLRAASLSSSTLQLDWTNDGAGADGIIYDAGTGASIKTLPPAATSDTLVGPDPGSTYCAYVSAYNQAGFSIPSNRACFTTPP